jgi:GT2 family glycosyltransferase
MGRRHDGGNMRKLSIVIPTWKNLEYLDLCYDGIVANSAAQHEIIVFFNEYDADCGRWAKGKNVLFDKSPENLGVCGAVNRAVKLATTEYVCYLNDDMYPLPGWDTALEQYLGIAEKLWLSGTAVEAEKAAACYIGGQDYGRTPGDFQKDRLLKDCARLKRPYNMVSTWTPMLISRKDWDAVGGFDENYFPGNGSDPDLAMKMYKHGCRHFIGVGTSLVYHFSRQTIGRFDDRSVMDPKSYFEEKWGMTWKKFLGKVIYRDEIITDNLLEKMLKR